MVGIPEFERSLFLEGVAGSGKTNAACQYISHLLQEDVMLPENMLIIVPHPALARPYEQMAAALNNPSRPFIATLSGFSRLALPYYWDWIKQEVPNLAAAATPTFLSADISQYHLNRFVQPYLKMGVFNSIHLPAYRVVTQILDGINNAVQSDLSLEDMQKRLTAAWGNRHSSRLQIYQTVTEIARQYQNFCLENGFLDYALQIHLLTHILLDNAAFQADFQQQFRCLVVDNVEEMGALTHDFIFWAMENVEKTLIIYDQNGGYRVFTGADPVNALLLRDICTNAIVINEPATRSPQMQAVVNATQTWWETNPPALANNDSKIIQAAVKFSTHTFYPQMIEHCIQQVQQLVVEQKVSPGQIAIVTPFLQDTLLLTLQSQLQAIGIPGVHYRPSRPLIHESAVKAFITFMRLAYPSATSAPTAAEVAHALSLAVDGLDPLRAFLLTQIVYQRQTLASFESITSQIQVRITQTMGERYETLRLWLLEQAALPNPPDNFPNRLLTEVLSQPGFNFIGESENTSAVKELVAAAERFVSAQSFKPHDDLDIIREFIEFTLNGFVVSTKNTANARPDAVFIAPVHTYLTRDIVVDYQFWLDVGDSGWYRRIEQPLTQPYVLRRDFPAEAVWTDELEFELQAHNLRNLILGLLRRCRKGVFVETCDISASGYEQRGQLLVLLQQLFNQPSASRAT